MSLLLAAMVRHASHDRLYYLERLAGERLGVRRASRQIRALARREQAEALALGYLDLGGEG